MRSVISCALISNVLLIFAVLHSEPWGKDADLARRCTVVSMQNSAVCTTPLVGAIGETLIAFHQQVVSPADGPRSHFIPSSSQYTLDAMRRYGFFCGVAYGCDRLMRENSDEWIYPTIPDGSNHQLKYDPVP